MGDRVVVYCAKADSEASGSVANRLRARGIQIVEEQPKMLLAQGDDSAIKHVVDQIDGWDLTAEQKTEPPPTREQVLKPPRK